MRDDISHQWADKPFRHTINQDFRIFRLWLAALLGLSGGQVKFESHADQVERLAISRQAMAVNLADPSVKPVEFVITDEFSVSLSQRMATVGFRPQRGKLGADRASLRRMSQAHSRIPVWMFLQPREGFRRKTLHRYPRENLVVLHLEVTNPPIIQDNIRIENFTRQRVDAARSNRTPNIIVQPADKVVTGVLRILLHMCPRGGILIIDLNRVGQAHFIEGLVPHQNPLAHPAAIAHRCRVLDVENDRVFHWADFQLGIRLFQMPAVDVAHFCFIVRVLAKIGVPRGKISHSVIRQPRLVGLARRDGTDGIVKRFQNAVADGYCECNFNIGWERLCGTNFSQAGIDP